MLITSNPCVDRPAQPGDQRAAGAREARAKHPHRVDLRLRRERANDARARRSVPAEIAFEIVDRNGLAVLADRDRNRAARPRRPGDGPPRRRCRGGRRAPLCRSRRAGPSRGRRGPAAGCRAGSTRRRRARATTRAARRGRLLPPAQVRPSADARARRAGSQRRRQLSGRAAGSVPGALGARVAVRNGEVDLDEMCRGPRAGRRPGRRQLGHRAAGRRARAG